MISSAISRIDYTILSILIGISGVFGAFYVVLRQQLNILSVKAFLLFICLTFLYFFILSLTSIWYIADARWNFFIVQLFSLGSGILFARVMFVHRDQASENLQSDIVLIFFLCFIGMWSYYLGYCLWSKYIILEVLEEGDVSSSSKVPLFACLACIPFVLPYFIQLSYTFVNKIPVPIYPKWYYPLKKDLPPFDYGDGDPQTKVNLQFSTKELGGEDFTRLTLIPNEMVLGDFFHVYFDTWNERQETIRHVELTDQYDRPFAFRFYAVHKDNLNNKRRLDPNKTTFFNKLSNEDLIFIERESRYL